MSILVADSGGTSTDWFMVDGKADGHLVQSIGLNPNTREKKEIETTISQQAGNFKNVNQVYFYGAGCSTIENKEWIESVLKTTFPNATVLVDSDLVGAGLAVFGKQEGILGILGTGSNSAVFKDGKVVTSRPSFGYLLGDEGSGSDIGARFLKRALEGEFSDSLMAAIHNNFDLSEERVIRELYHNHQRPTAYFGSFVPFIGAHIDQFPGLKGLVKGCFQDYCRYFLEFYRGTGITRVGFVGSVAYYFKDILKEVIAEKGFELTSVLKAPAPGLRTYFSRG